MQTSELIRKHADLAGELLGLDLSTPAKVEELRHRWGGHFGVTHYRRTRHWDEAAAELGIAEANRVAREQVSETELIHNIVVNEGLDYGLDVALSGGTQIVAADWKVALVKTDTTAAATQTYATPVYTEIAATDVTETVRQDWTDAGVSGQSADNSASPATYTADATFTAFGASIVGGGTGEATIADTAGGGTMWCYSKFGTSKAMVATDTIDITYTLTAADA